MFSLRGHGSAPTQQRLVLPPMIGLPLGRFGLPRIGGRLFHRKIGDQIGRGFLQVIRKTGGCRSLRKGFRGREGKGWIWR